MKPILATLLLGGISAIDATPMAQTLFSQPLVTATVLGWIWNDWALALKVGVVLQILAASTLPIGARTPEDYATGGVVGAGLALALASQQQYSVARDGCALVGSIAGMIVATAGVPLLKWQRRLNEGLGRWSEAEILRGRAAALGDAQRAAVVLAFALGVAYCAVALGLGYWGLHRFVGGSSLRLSRVWSLAQPLWLGLGLAQLLNAFVQRRPARAAMFGVALCVAWLALVIGAPSP